MQFPVPQFTDVEDKIIGPFSLKQFGFVFGAGVIIFLGFSATKSILVAIFLFLIVGLPAVSIAFVPFNGRPIYKSLDVFIKFFTSPRELIFHKEAEFNSSLQIPSQKPQPQKAEIKPQTPLTPQENLKKVQELLRKTADQERQEAKNKY